MGFFRQTPGLENPGKNQNIDFAGIPVDPHEFLE